MIDIDIDTPFDIKGSTDEELSYKIIAIKDKLSELKTVKIGAEKSYLTVKHHLGELQNEQQKRWSKALPCRKDEVHSRYAFADKLRAELISKLGRDIENANYYYHGGQAQKIIKKIERCNKITEYYLRKYFERAGV